MKDDTRIGDEPIFVNDAQLDEGGRPVRQDLEKDVEATPAAEAAAEETDVDLGEVKGTGKGGKVTKADVEKAAE